jgi:polysaccharide deacetylase family protein (PEP-CTERM system associated)
MPMKVGMTHADDARPPVMLTFDVEEYFHVEAAFASVGPTRWADWPRRVDASVDRLLDACDRHGTRATFFILGDVARASPRLARRCADAGHEVASHGSMHDRIHRLTPDALAADLRDSKAILEDQTGRAVLGYRAPTWSVTRATAWAVDALLDAGFAYDASVFPVRHPQYGVPDAPAWPHLIRATATAEPLLEVPPLVYRVAGRNLAAAGGGYFRLLPLALMTRALTQARAEQRPAVLYFHPWEFDPGIPRLPLPTLQRLRTYTGLRSAMARLHKLLRHTGPTDSIASQLPTLRRLARQRTAFTLAA